MNLRTITTVAALTLLTAGAYAQGPGSGGPGGFQPTPQMMAQMQAWRKWRDNHKNVVSVQQTVGAIQRMEQDPKTRLNKTQAHTVLAVLGKWRSKPVMTDTQARQVNQQLTASLTIPQLKALAADMSHRGRGPGGGRPGGGGFRGGPGGSAMSAPHDYNPLNPDTSPFPPMRQRAKQRLNDLMTTLKQTK